MRLISNQEGRFVYLFPLDEMRPVGGIHLIEIVEKITDNYAFSGPPDLDKPVREFGFDVTTFRDGSKTISNKQINISELSIYNDGIVAAAATTQDAELVVDDFFNWSTKALDFRRAATKPETRYASTVIVEFEKKTNLIIKNWELIANLAQTLLKETYKIELTPQLNALSLSVDPQSLPRSLIIGSFMMERRAGTSFAIERFFSQAPLSNKSHMLWLEGLEAIIT